MTEFRLSKTSNYASATTYFPERIDDSRKESRNLAYRFYQKVTKQFPDFIITFHEEKGCNPYKPTEPVETFYTSIKIDNLDQLLLFIKTVGEEVIITENSLEIYDGYRE